MKSLSIKNVNKFYKLGNKEKFQALRDINLDFTKGELVSVVGESGSGKSTLMNLIGGLDSDFSGDIEVYGTNLQGLKDKQLDKYRKNKVGFVFQSFNLIPHLSILDNVTISLTLSGVSEHEKVKKATMMLEKVGLGNQLKKKPNQLSGGQKQRVAIARALINDPDIILADEPTGALDTETTGQILEILKKIADDGKLVIMVTHSEKVASISSRVIELSDGKVIRDEKNKNYKKYKTRKNREKLEVSKTKNEKQSLGFWSAIKLAFHNMWASKTKNFLMAFGVAISISSLILMLSFSSGLTGYIQSMASQYSSPTIVTISKKGDSSDPFSFVSPSPFTREEIVEVVNDLNNNALQITDYKIDIENDVSYGYMAVTGLTRTASITYTNSEDEELNSSLFAVYTTPKYYNSSNLIKGEISKENEIMVSQGVINQFGEEAFGRTVTISIDFNGTIIKKSATITAIVESSMFNSMNVLYIDYDFLSKTVYQETLNQTGEGVELEPSSIYIETDSQETTNIINNYIKTKEAYSGSMEEKLATMFSQMMDTFGIALAIISGISLIVASIMILVVLYISVTERTKEIGVLKSIGARKKDIKLIFTSESFLVGLLSGLVGCALSLISIILIKIILTAIIGFAPITLTWYYFLISILIAVFISVLSGLYPSSKASKLDPVEALRRE